MRHSPAGKRRQRELTTVSLMIELYQRAHPAPADDDQRYVRLRQYAQKRLEKCRFGEEKPACKNCPIHCYQPARRTAIKAIMRWAGPRMLLYHPILALRHLLDERRPAPPGPGPGGK